MLSHPGPGLVGTSGVEEAELCLKRCFSQSGSIPCSLEGDAECPPFVQDVQPVGGGTANQRCLFGRPGRALMVFVCDSGAGGRRFPITVAFPPTS